MPSSLIVRTAIFTAGAVLGGGLAAVVTTNRKKDIVPHAPSAALVRVDQSGKATFSSDVTTASPLPVLKYGHPGPIADLLVRKAYVAAYDRRLRHPAWTAEHLTSATLAGTGKRGDSDFEEDTSLPVTFRSRLQDYFRSGYDRGHMVPAADAKMSQEAMDQTFLLSNIAPQVGDGFNRHYWAYLEEWCRRLTDKFQDVYVFTVPLYLPKKDADGKWRITHEVIGSPPNVGVPTHFAKVILTAKPSSPSTPDVLQIATGAFVLPNATIPDKAPLESFAVPVDTVERAAGLTLFSDQVKAGSQQLCKAIKCDVTVRRFDDAQKQNVKAIAGPKS